MGADYEGGAANAFAAGLRVGVGLKGPGLIPGVPELKPEVIFYLELSIF